MFRYHKKLLNSHSVFYVKILAPLNVLFLYLDKSYAEVYNHGLGTHQHYIKKNIKKKKFWPLLWR